MGCSSYVTVLAGKGRCARDMLPHYFDISVFKTVKTNSTTIKYIHNQSANTIKGLDVAFWHQWLLVSVIGMERMVTLARLRYTRAYLPLGIFSLIKHAAMGIMMPFPAQIHTAML